MACIFIGGTSISSVIQGIADTCYQILGIIDAASCPVPSKPAPREEPWGSASPYQSLSRPPRVLGAERPAPLWSAKRHRVMHPEDYRAGPKGTTLTRRVNCKSGYCKLRGAGRASPRSPVDSFR